ncbi:MAG: Mut7-C ubiquitin/RNAse domain-containing protein [Anaerolineae bacterium]|nr:Mut7-C ubiquitin/RNAse domain-containing protein [Anaerolineae bacterium]
MDSAWFRFYDSLNDFLPRSKRNAIIEHHFDWRASIKDMIESLGVPHCEIERITAHGAPVDFAYIVQANDQIEVYPGGHAGSDPHLPLRPPLPDLLRFVLDTHLGRLAAYLRMLGFDTLYRNDYSDDQLARISSGELRVLLTRDIGLLKRSLVTYGYFMRETNPRRQLAEIIRRYHLLNRTRPFRHCMKCNGLLEPVEKADILAVLPNDTAQHYDVFHRCQSCGQVYWKGPHYQRMNELIAQVRREV